ncbi:expressed unknown protein [Seminavis robusta]|uniref:Uncharacterized protein n=1 Tax=Seminavis robusta TaxID=568900 RepID=A0A9N8E1J4_9STRA|nr:expressed unknown protein [Seminavis robusta]|eukprot:Sro525_g160200.1 n/a (256) ;mRNA; f:51541-52308
MASSSSCSTVCASMAKIIKQNNDGIRRLETQDYSKAAALLSSSVSDLKLLLAECDAEASADAAVSRPCYELVFSFVLESATAIAGGGSDNDNNSVVDSTDGFIFEAPIKVSRVRRDGTAEEEDSITEMLKRLSFSVVYNLAVSFHMSAIRSASLTNKKLSQRLRKALAFYKMALDLARQYDIAVGSMEALAIANNQAHIHRLLNETQDAERCRALMLSNIMYASEHGNPTKDIVHFEKFVASATDGTSNTTAKAA